jgi:glycerophosphoryl diester phosphodiesterase
VRRPLIFAHRGGIPEHTVEAYEKALALGADGLECDVRLTRDGHLVCVHDPRIEQRRISDSTLAQLDGVLTLDRLITVARAARRPVRLLVETKHPTRYGAAVERQLIAALSRHGLLAPDPAQLLRVTAMSFSPLALRLLRDLAPALPTVLLLDYLPRRVPVARLPFGARTAGPGIRLVRSRPDLVARLRERGYRVYVWTVNDPADIDLVVGLGVDGIITDHPSEVLARLNGRAA